jgi:hypothetical protein
VGEIFHAQGFTSLNAPGQEAVVINSLTLEQYHQICYWNLSHRRIISISPEMTVNLGAIIPYFSTGQLQDWVEIALLPDVDPRCGGWRGADGEVLEDGWTRCFICFTWKAIHSNHVHSSFNSNNLLNCTLSANMWYDQGCCWLSQANHIFTCLGITSNFENYCTFQTRAWSHFCSNLLE